MAKQNIESVSMYFGALDFGTDNDIWIGFQQGDEWVAFKLSRFAEWFKNDTSEVKCIRGSKNPTEPTIRPLVAIKEFKENTFTFYSTKTSKTGKGIFKGVKPIKITLANDQLRILKNLCECWTLSGTDTKTMRKLSMIQNIGDLGGDDLEFDIE
ncbi:hypothetical protein [Helicobacter suis]|uniref:hypothetical protein n=1 Tax=Helicobacter suis TaxID=104628 RepID=UPI0013CFFB96|nr:hypothetical protein [Helicobacter suis]